MNIGDVFLALRADGARFQAEAVKEAQKAGDAAGRTLGERLKAGFNAKNIGTALGAAFGGALGGALKMADEYDDAMDSIRAGTGATGDALAGLEGSFTRAAGRVKEDIGLTSQVLADLNSRTGATGQALEDLTVRVIEFSRVTKSDAVANTAALTRVFGDWSIATEDQAETMNQLMRAGQASGIEMDRLMQTVVQFGAPLRLLGFEFEDSIAMLAKWEKEGVNVETALTGMKFSLKTLAREGVPAAEFATVLRQRFDDIKNSADPVGESIKLFGLRAGPDLAAAITEGRFATEDILDVIKNGGDTVDTAAGDMRDFADGFAELKNKVKLAIGPILKDFTGLTTELGNAVYLLPALGGALGRGLGSLWSKAAKSQLATRAVAAAGSAAATLYLRALIVGDAIIGALRSGWAKVPGSGVLRRAIAKAAAVAASLYLGALIVGDAIGAALSGAWTKVAGTGSKATKAAGAAGRAAGLAFTLGMVLFAAKIAEEIEPHITKAGQDIHKWLFPDGGPFDDLHPEEWPWPFGPKLGPKVGNDPIRDLLAPLFQGVEDGVTDVSDAVAELPGKVADDLLPLPGIARTAAGETREELLAMGLTPEEADAQLEPLKDAVTDAFGVIVPKITDGAEAWDKYRADSAAAQDQAITDQLDFTSKALSDLTSFQSGVETALSGVYSAENDAHVTKNRIIILQAELSALDKERVAEQKKLAEDGKKLTKAQIADYHNRGIGIIGELEQLKLHAALIGDDMHRVTALTALLTASDMKEGLLSENDNIRTSYEVQRDKIIQYLKDIETQGGPAAKAASALLAQWLDPTNPMSPMYGVAGAAGTAATDYVNKLSRNLEYGTPNVKGKIAIITKAMDLKDEARGYGYATGAAYSAAIANGIKSNIYGSGGVVWSIGKIAALMRAESPPKPGAVLYGIDKWGGATGEAFVSPLVSQIQEGAARLRGVLGEMAGTLTAPLGTGSAAIGMAGAAALDNRTIPTLPAQASDVARAAVGGDTYVTNLHVPANPTRDVFGALEVARRYQAGGFINPKLKPT